MEIIWKVILLSVAFYAAPYILISLALWALSQGVYFYEYPKPGR